MGLFKRLFGKRQDQQETSETTPASPASPAAGGQKIPDITKAFEEARARHQLPEPAQIVSALVAVEESTNYATVVRIALETAAEIRGIHIGDLKSAYMKLWWQWHNHQDEPPYRAKKAIVIASEAAQVLSGSEIAWPLISVFLVWAGRGCPDRADDLKKHFGNVPSLEEIRKFQGIA